MIRQESIETFLDRLASSSPTPGGGGAAALSGALGCALGRMVANLTIGRKKYASVEEEMIRADQELAVLQEDLLDLADRDEAVFSEYMESLRLPKETECQKMLRDRAVISALNSATENPLKIMEKAAAALRTVVFTAEAGNKNAVSDAGAAANMLLSALETGAENVRINLAAMDSEEQVSYYEAQMEPLLSEGRELAEKIRKIVSSRISGK